METNLRLELPQGWAWTSIREVATSLKDGTHNPPKRVENGIPLLSARNIKNGYVDWNEEYSKISLDDFEQMSKNNPIQINDILLTIVGSLGRACVFDGKTKFAVQRSVAIIRVFEDLLSPSYLSYYLTSPQGMRFLEDNAKGTAQKGVYLGVLGTMSIPLPPLAEQRRIVARIGQTGRNITAIKSAIAHSNDLLSTYRPSILRNAFEGRLTESWRENNTECNNVTCNGFNEDGNESSGFAKESVNLPTISPSWKFVRIRSIISSMKNGIYKPKQFYNENGTACLRMYNINDGRIVWSDVKRMNLTRREIKEYSLMPGDILVNRVNSRELVGKAAVIPNKIEECVYESKNIRLRIRNDIADSNYVNYWFLFFSQNYFSRNAQQVVGMASINQDQIGNMPIPLPSLTEQKVIADCLDIHISSTGHIADVLERDSKDVDRCQQSLLRRAFEGKLVPQDLKDEPAERLLERIQKERAKGKLMKRSKDGLEVPG